MESKGDFMSKVIKIELLLRTYLCNNCRIVIQSEILQKFQYISLINYITPSKTGIICERCGYEDKEYNKEKEEL